MTAPPLPASPCVRVNVKFNHDSGLEAGCRFYLSYSGSAPTGANCTTLAGDIEGLFVTAVMGALNSVWTLVEIDVLDIATDSGLSGQWTGSVAGTETGTAAAASLAMNVEFGIARRYRGGKPRIYLPPSSTGNLANDVSWNPTFINDIAANIAAMMASIHGLSVGSMGTLQHVNLSFYKGFTNVENTSGRMRAAPTYRSVALVDTVTGYFGKTEVGSQRRRRTSTSY